VNVRHRRRAGTAIVLVILLSGIAMLAATRAPAAPTPRPVSALCDARAQLPAPLWRVLVLVFHLRCGPGATTTTTTGTRTSTTTGTTTGTRTSTTFPVPADAWAVRGTLQLVRCSGTPAAPVDCGPPVPNAGEVVARGRTVPTDAAGNYFVAVGPGPAAVQGRVSVPPNLIVDCPVVTVPIPEGPTPADFDPVCRAFPA
jgi:hypothetical protein